MFISQQMDSLTEAERYFNPLYLIVQKGKEHLKQQLVRGSVCDCDTTLPNRRIGIFSVAPNKHVTFSQGNLQYFPAAKLWKFADNQYDILGNANQHLSPTFRNWVDLFGYSANNTTAPFGISTSTNNADYTGDFVDWGNNWICGDKPNTWRTLSKDEWEYFPQPIYIAPNEYLVFGKPSEDDPTLVPCYNNKGGGDSYGGTAHYIGDKEASVVKSVILMVEFYSKR